MRAIFISYRRDDAEGQAGRLFEDLEERFGKASVFMDVTGIEPGRDFRKVIEQQVASCGVLLAIIGRDWLTATDADGHRRLDDSADFVRLETAAALKRDIPVIPVLVRGAKMPRAEQLPEVLADLSFRNSVELSHARWASDVQLLINALLPHVDVSPELAPTAAGGVDRAVPGAAVASSPSTPAGVADVPAARTGDAVGRLSAEGLRSGRSATPSGVGDAGTDSRSKWWAGGGLAAIAVAGLGYLAWDRSEPEASGERRGALTPVPAADAVATADAQIRASAPAASPVIPPAAPPVAVAAPPAAQPTPSATAMAGSPSTAIAPAAAPLDFAPANPLPRATGTASVAGVPAPSGALPVASAPGALPLPTDAAVASERTKPDKAMPERLARAASSSRPDTSQPARDPEPEAATSRRSAAAAAAAARAAPAVRPPAADRDPREQPSAERSAPVLPNVRPAIETAPAPYPTSPPTSPTAPAETTTAAVRSAAAPAPPARSVPAEPPVVAASPSPTRLEPPRSSVPLALLGDPAPLDTATRTIAIHPTTRYINVTGGEIVRFTVGDKSFAWNFSGRPSSFDLSVVAPPGILDRKVTAYVAPNPLYRTR